jgi:spore germination protein YaaH
MPKLDQVMCRVLQFRVLPASVSARSAAVAICCAILFPLSSSGPFAPAHLVARTPIARAQIWAFTGPWDAASDASLARHAGAIDIAVTGWIALDSATAAPVQPPLYRDNARLAGSRAARFAIVTSWHGLSFHPSSVRTLGSSAVRLGRVAHRIAAAARRAGYRGLVLDFEDEQPHDLPLLLDVVKAITDSAHAHGVSQVAIAVPAADNAAYPTRALLGVTDLLLPMLYDEHWDSSAPGAISDPSWVRSTLAARLAGIDRHRIVAGLPTYAYHWPRGKSGEQMSYDDARSAAARNGVRLTRDAATQTLHATEPNGDQYWATDAELLRTLVGVVRSLGVERVSLWRLGQEDPAIWRDGVLQ